MGLTEMIVLDVREKENSTADIRILIKKLMASNQF